MSHSHSLAVQKAILECLSSNSALKALMGDPVRIYDQKPSETTMPFAHLERHQVKPLCEEAGFEEHILSLTLHSVFEGSEEIKAIIPQIRLALEAEPLMSDLAILGPVRLVFTDVFRAPDGRSHYGLMRFRLSAEPLTNN